MKIEKVEVFGMDATNVHAVPGGPGLGVTLDDAKLEKYRLDLKAAA